MPKQNPKKTSQPPSLFDNLDLFQPAADAAGGKPAANAKPKAATSREPKATNHESRTTSHEPRATPPDLSLTGSGPMRDLYDFNFRQYSAYVICSRAIPAVEDGLKPVQRRILHSLWEKDDGRYTKVANIVGHAMQYHPHGDASIGDAIVVLARQLA